MNCKQGDLAIVKIPTGEYTGNNGNGKIVRCVKLHPFMRLRWPTKIANVANVWVVDPPLCLRGDGTLSAFVQDAWLRPLGNPGDDEVDETLRERNNHA